MVLATGATYVELRGTVYCSVATTLAAEATEGLLFELGGANPFSGYCDAVSYGSVGTFC